MILNDILSIVYANFFSFLISIITVVLTIGYSFSEQERKRINNCIKLLGQEISWNRNKYAIYKEVVESEKEMWKKQNKLNNIGKWVDEISVGEKGSTFVLFKFEAFNYYINSDIPSYLDLYFPYKLAEFYGASYKFCNKISNIKNEIEKYQKDNNIQYIDTEFKKMDAAFDEFREAFWRFTSCINDLKDIEYCGITEIKWSSWHLKKFGVQMTNPRICFKDKAFLSRTPR